MHKTSSRFWKCFDKLPSSIRKTADENFELLKNNPYHPSPFSAPEKFGGYDKLEKLYNLDIETVSKTVFSIIEIIEKIESMKGGNPPVPIWLPEIKTAANDLFQLSAKNLAR